MNNHVGDYVQNAAGDQGFSSDGALLQVQEEHGRTPSFFHLPQCLAVGIALSLG